MECNVNHTKSKSTLEKLTNMKQISELLWESGHTLHNKKVPKDLFIMLNVRSQLYC